MKVLAQLVAVLQELTDYTTDSRQAPNGTSEQRHVMRTCDVLHGSPCSIRSGLDKAGDCGCGLPSTVPIGRTVTFLILNTFSNVSDRRK